jgi:hypothetical protein
MSNLRLPVAILDHIDLTKSIEALRNDANRLQLYSLYKQYVDIMEHLHVLNGGIPIDGYKYNPEYLKRGGRSWLNDIREELKKKIEELS